jgi:hypothetical protein
LRTTVSPLGAVPMVWMTSSGRYFFSSSTSAQTSPVQEDAQAIALGGGRG